MHHVYPFKRVSHLQRAELLNVTQTGTARCGMTLVEMLVGMAITLVMMAAVVNLFANVSGSVRNRRAAIEMSGTLRQARSQLARDLAGATCPAVPWQDPAAGNGYLEIIEGRWSDSNPSSLIDGNAANGELNYATSLVPSTQTVDTSTGNVTDGGALGDYDDILALTVRSAGEPFVGQWNNAATNRIESAVSSEAEIVWFAIENPANGALGEPGLRTVYRRVLIIKPSMAPIVFPNNPAAFFQANDISAHYDTSINAWVPNSLSDLTKRENRFLRNNVPTAYPFPLFSEGSGFSNNSTVSATVTGNATVQGVTNNLGQVTGYSVTNDGGQYAALPSAMPLITFTVGTTKPTPHPVMQRRSPTQNVWKVAHVTNGPAPLAFARQGGDVVLSDVLAWDLRVFDPGAPLMQRNNTVLSPNDFGWVMPNAASVVGLGTFVNLGWSPLYSWVSPLPAPSFQIPRQAGWHPRLPTQLLGYPAVYDTWSTHYESDGVDQDNRDGDNNILTGADEFTNNFDDDGINGVDDAGERETSPPYDVPLKAVRAIFRTYERDTRQIRETSVTHSFRE